MAAEDGLPPSSHPRVLGLRVTPVRRLAFFAGVDAALLCASVLLAFFVRFEGILPPDYAFEILFDAALFTVATIGFLLIYGIYRVSWSYVGLRDIAALGVAVTLASVVVGGVVLIGRQAGPLAGFPRSIVVIQAYIALLFLAGFRLSKRVVKGLKPVANADARPTIIIGAGTFGFQILKNIQDTGLRRLHEVVGFLDDDPLAHRTYILGVPVLGAIDSLEKHIRRYGVQSLIIALPKVPGPLLRQISDQAHALGVDSIRIIPPLSEIVEGQLTFQATRAITLEDLLGRDPIEIRTDELRQFVKGKVVAVTGGAGTIGTELCRQIASLEPKELAIVDIDETRLHDLGLTLEEAHRGLRVARILLDVREGQRVDEFFAAHRPDIVFHAAAYKHVPMMEAWPVSALAVNVLGTHHVLAASERHGAERFVLVSTDKAVEPSSVMGASKRLAELVVLGEGSTSSTIRSAVRFGNVLGSRGSVIPTFERQLKQGGPLTVTHPEIERFFMVTSEAVTLVLQSGALGTGGDLFVLDMGKPVRIVDMAREFIRLNGLEPDRDIPIQFTGLRPGEKLYEKLSYPEEKLQRSAHPKILRGELSESVDVPALLAQVRKVVESGDAETARALLRTHFPNLGQEGSLADAPKAAAQ